MLLRYLSSVFWIILTGFGGACCAQGIWDQLWRPAKVFPLPTLVNKVGIVTGSNTGVGEEIAKALAESGMHVILACRDMGKAEQAAAAIKLSSRNDKVEAWKLDLASLESVRQFAQRFKAAGLPLHVLVNNAGVMFGPYVKTKEGFEMQLGVNHLGHFLLTNLLLDQLEESAGRIVVLSSAAHVFGTINWDDLQSEKFYSPYTAYMQSKLADLLFCYELHRRLQEKGSKVKVNACHPGVVQTPLWRHMPFWMAILMLGMRPLMKSARAGATTPLWLAVSPDAATLSGQYFAECNAKLSNLASYSKADQRRLWDVSAKLVGL